MVCGECCVTAKKCEMTLKTFEKPAAFMVHDLGPSRFYKKPRRTDRWSRTSEGQRLLTLLRRHGLDHRDVYVADRAIT